MDGWANWVVAWEPGLGTWGFGDSRQYSTVDESRVECLGLRLFSMQSATLVL